MSTVNEEQVLNIARLSRLAIHEKDVPKYAQDLSKILELVDQMNQAQLDGVEPMAHPFEVTQRLRADDVTEKDEHKKFQSIAPAVEAGLYLVPQVIE